MSPAPAPVVSICCITYNHAAFIRDAIEGFLKQDFSQPLEILIHDDASTDGTAAIVREYAGRHPGTILPILQSENQFSRGIKILPTFLFPRARGRYIALCEGDDCWTDPAKLRRQVEFLEAHPDFTLTSGGYQEMNLLTGASKPVILVPSLRTPGALGYEFTLDDLKTTWITKTLTLVFRNEKEVFDRLFQYELGRDVNLVYHLLKGQRKGFYFTSVLGIYRFHQGGVFGLKSEGARRHVQYRVYRDLHQKNRDEFTRVKDLLFSLRLLNFCLFQGRPPAPAPGRLGLLLHIARLVRKPREIRLLLSFLAAPRP